jgi:hypothetical protein
MKGVGWEIRPLGWIALAAALGIVIFFAIRWLRPTPQNVDKKNQ